MWTPASSKCRMIKTSMNYDARNSEYAPGVGTLKEPASWFDRTRH